MVETKQQQQQTINPLASFTLGDLKKEPGSASSSSSVETPSNTPTPPIFDPSLFQFNPGSYEDLHKKTKDIYPQCFEGFRFQLNKQLSSHFQINHSLTLSTMMPSGYKFGVTYVGNNYISQQEVSILLV